MHIIGTFVSALYLFLFNLIYPLTWYTSLNILKVLYWLVGKQVPRNYTDYWATFWGIGQKIGIFFFSRTKTDLKHDPALKDYDGPVLVIMNHQATFDIGMAFDIMWECKRFVRWVLKRELLKAPVVRQGCMETKCAFVDRKDRAQAQQEIARFAKQVEEDNVSPIIFVEGSRATEAKLAKSDFKHLLNPKPLGFTILREALPDWPVLSVTIHWHNKSGTTMFATSIWNTVVQIESKLFTPEEIGDEPGTWLLEKEWPRCDALIDEWIRTHNNT